MLFGCILSYAEEQQGQHRAPDEGDADTDEEDGEAIHGAPGAVR